MKIKNRNPITLSVKMYLLLGFLLLNCIKAEICFMYGRVLHEGDIQSILQCIVI